MTDRYTFVSAIFLLLGTLALASPTPASAGENWLITPEEAAMQVRDGEMAIPVAAVEGPGPNILLKDPKMLKKLVSPVDIYVAFEPGASKKPADMRSLKVTLVGFIDINITDRLKEYIKGTNLEVEKANLPSGKHRLRMHIEDVAGNPNERDIFVTVVKK